MNYKHIYALCLLSSISGSAFAQIALNGVASRALGSPSLNVTSPRLTPNLVEGREMWQPLGIAVDSSLTPPAIYVSDTGNNRVLGWRDMTGFKNHRKADIQIGQPDLLTTFAAGPNAKNNTNTGLLAPTAIAVYRGDLYVADSGNNRVLRFRSPFSQFQPGTPYQYPTPDLFIGQSTLNSGAANCYTTQATPTGICLSSGSTLYQTSIAFDSAGNLWLTDPGNLRVLRFPAGPVAGGGGSSKVQADLELGQFDLSSIQGTKLGTDINSQNVKNQFWRPSALGFDPNGNLFVTDSTIVTSNNQSIAYARVLVFSPPFTVGMSAARLMGVFPSGYKLPTDPMARQALQDSTGFLDAEAVFFLTGVTQGVGVVDRLGNRVMIFDSYANWNPDGSPPTARTILGQPYTCPAQQPGAPVYEACYAANNGQSRPSGGTFSGPSAVAYTGTDLFVADAGNNRVLDLVQSGSTFGPATGVIGQDRMDTNSINLVEGREFQFANAAGSFDAGVVIDNTSTPPHLYVADSGNNRVLGFKNLWQVKPGASADIVIGQPDFQTTILNFPDPTQPSQSNLAAPIGLTLDGAGNLYVADSLNGRVMRFATPFAHSNDGNPCGLSTCPYAADLVLGKSNFTTSNFPDAAKSNLNHPYGLAFSGSNGLVVSDQGNNRVLYFPTTNGTFTEGVDNGKQATVVFGQQSVNGSAAGSDQMSLNSPHHVSCDSSGYVYVADTGNNRVMIFPDPHAGTTSPVGQAAPAVITGLSAPSGVYVNPATNEIWIANTNAGTVVRYTSYNSVQLPETGSINSIQDTSSGIAFRTLAIAQDAKGNLVVADDAYRVGFFYRGLTVCNGASFLPVAQPGLTNPTAPTLCAGSYDSWSGPLSQSIYLAPNALGSILPCVNCAGNQFTDTTAQFDGYPVAKVLSDVQVAMDGLAAPLYYVSSGSPGTDHPSGQINFIVPNNAKTNGYSSLEVVQKSTGQVLGAAQVAMSSQSPGILICADPSAFKANPNQRPICAINAADNSVNLPSNPVARGSYLSIYATGQGYIPNAPPDGTPASSALSTPATVEVLFNGHEVNDLSTNGGENFQHISYAGINSLPGVLQINVRVPQTVVPSTSASPTSIIIRINGFANYVPGINWKTYVYVK